MKMIAEPPRQVPVVVEADVIVAGGGPGGLPAAIAAARHGASVVLIERHGFLAGYGRSCGPHPGPHGFEELHLDC